MEINSQYDRKHPWVVVARGGRGEILSRHSTEELADRACRRAARDVVDARERPEVVYAG